jgi:hypothetical protein
MQICRYKLENNTQNSVLDCDSNKTIMKKIFERGRSSVWRKVMHLLYALVIHRSGKLCENLVSLDF